MVKFWWRHQKYVHVMKWLALNVNQVRFRLIFVYFVLIEDSIKKMNLILFILSIDYCTLNNLTLLIILLSPLWSFKFVYPNKSIKIKKS